MYSPTISQSYAGFWIRFAAAWIDGIIVQLGGGIIAFIIGGFYGLAGGTSEGGQVIGFFLGVLLGWFYFAILESSPKQATLGKMAVGIMVTDVNGYRLTFGKASGRYFAKYLSLLTFFIGYIVVAFTDKKQALHDLVAGTLVIKKRETNVGVIIAIIILGFIGLLFVIGILSAILLPSFIVQPKKPKEAEAKTYIGSINRGQQAYFIENNKFTDSLSALGIGISSETDNYSYNIELYREGSIAVSTANAKNSELKSFGGLVYVKGKNSEKTTESILCQTNSPSLAFPDFKSIDECPSGSSSP